LDPSTLSPRTSLISLCIVEEMHARAVAGTAIFTGGGTGGTRSGSPIKESIFPNREMGVDGIEEKDMAGDRASDSVSTPPVEEGILIQKIEWG
jgi:hypothetical protein